MRQLDDGRTSLDDALQNYEEGIRLLRHCTSLLEGAKRRIEILRGTNEDGTPVLEPLSEADVKTEVSVSAKN